MHGLSKQVSTPLNLRSKRGKTIPNSKIDQISVTELGVLSFTVLSVVVFEASLRLWLMT